MVKQDAFSKCMVTILHYSINGIPGSSNKSLRMTINSSRVTSHESQVIATLCLHQCYLNTLNKLVEKTFHSHKTYRTILIFIIFTRILSFTVLQESRSQLFFKEKSQHLHSGATYSYKQLIDQKLTTNLIEKLSCDILSSLEKISPVYFIKDSFAEN